MSNLPISSRYVATPGRLVDADERDGVVARLNGAFEAGTIDDLDYRRYLDIAFAAKTLGELRPVVEKLPPEATYVTPTGIESATTAPGELTPARAPSGRLTATVLALVAVAVVVLIVILATLL